MLLLCSTDRHLLKDPQQADAYKTEMQKLIKADVVHQVSVETFLNESWYIPIISAGTGKGPSSLTPLTNTLGRLITGTFYFATSVPLVSRS